MEIALIAVSVVALLVGTAILSGRIGVAAPLLLVVLGVGIGYVPLVPLVEIDPEIILLGVLPPLLYAAAVNVPLVDFRRNFRPVVGLSVVLIVVSAVVVGLVIHLMVPAIPLPVGIALGAVVSPTDAVAATSIGKKLGMPPRLVSILEGESLVNDATSLVLLKTALAAISGGFVFWNAAGDFAFAVAGALVIGFAIGVVTVWVRSRLVSPVYDTVISFTVPFVAFIPAEAVGASGVLAVVVTGLYTGHHSAKRFSATARINERLNWRTVQFVIENSVFLLMGLQLHSLVEEVLDSPWHPAHLGLLTVAVVVVLILTRTAFTAPLLWSMRGSTSRYAARGEAFERAADRETNAGGDATKQHRLDLLRQRASADLAHEREQALGWRDGAVLSWSGMRGVVTLAAAQTIPVEVPYRAQVVLIAFLVAIITLLVHGLTLPSLIKKLWPQQGSTPGSARELKALGRDLVAAGNAALDDEVTAEQADESRPNLDPELIERARASGLSGIASLALAYPAEGGQIEGEEPPAQSYLRLTHVVIQAQREALLEERAIGRYSSQALRLAELALDTYEARLQPPASH